MSSLAWPNLEIDHGQPGPTEFRSLALEVLCGDLREDRKYHILDLGEAQGPNIEFFSKYPCRIFVEDFYRCLNSLAPRTEDDEPLSANVLSTLLSHDRDVQFDFILGWDLFDYFETDVIVELMKHLRGYCREGTLLFMLTSTLGEIPSEPAKFTIAGNNHLAYVPRSAETMRNPNYTPLAFEKMMKGFRLLHSFMLRNGMQEYIFTSS